MTNLYDTIGPGYSTLRRPDPRIERAIVKVLGEARRVLNVGAGTGSYEPRERFVVGVEPSRAMIRQRRSNAAPAVQASASALPFGDSVFDVSLAILTMHHWPDWRQGLRERFLMTARTAFSGPTGDDRSSICVPRCGAPFRHLRGSRTSIRVSSA